MGRPLLPAATDSGTDTAVDDVETDLSLQTDRSSFSVPENGSPIIVKKTRATVPGTISKEAQTELLINFYQQGGKPPKIRVELKPSSASKTENKDTLQKPSSVRRVSLVSSIPEQSTSRAVDATDKSPPVPNPAEFDIYHNRSDVSTISNQPAMQQASDVSSLKGDSVLDAPLGFKDPAKDQTSRALDQSVPPYTKAQDPGTDTLKPPPRDRNASQERIARKAAEKLSQENRAGDSTAKRRSTRTRSSIGSGDIIEDAYEDYKARSRHSSKSDSRPVSGDYRPGAGEYRSGTGDYRSATAEYPSGTGDYRSGGGSSVRPPRDADSNVSAASKGSFAPDRKLLQAVEDAIRRMILPEIDELKKRQSRSSDDRERRERKRSLSKQSSAPQIKAKESSRRELDGGTNEATRERRHKSRESRRSSGTTEGLTREALRDHNARSKEKERRERRKERSKSASASASISHTDESYRDRSKIPPMPLASDVGDSDLTRESIMSAETNSANAERPTTGDSRAMLPVRQVSRDSPTTVPLPESRGSTRTPTTARDRTPTQLEHTNSPRDMSSLSDLRAATSERNLASKSRSAAGLAAVGLGGAAGAMYGIDRYKAERSRSRELEKLAAAKRDMSPAQTVSSYRKSGAYTDDGDRPVSRDFPKESEIKDQPPQFAESVKSEENAEYSPTQKRYKGFELENQHAAHDRDLDYQSQSNETEEDFFKEQQRLNDEYRSSGDFDALRDSVDIGAGGQDLARGDKPNLVDSGDISAQKEVRDVAINPQVVSTPVRAESEVASLLEPSQLSSSHSRDIGAKPHTEQSPTDNLSQKGQHEQDSPTNQASQATQPDYSNPSHNRWAAIRENARALSHSKESLDNDPPQQNAPRAVESDEKVEMGASGLPVANDPLPEIGMGLDSASDSLSNPSLKEHLSSGLAGQMRDGNENREQWPYEPTPPTGDKRRGWAESESQDKRNISAGNVALGGAVAGLGIGAAGAAIAARANRGTQSASQDSMRELSSDSSASRESFQGRNITQSGPNAYSGYSNGIAQTPGYNKDEGYISAAPARSADDITPLSFSKPPPRLFDDRDIGNYQSAGADPFVNDKRARYLSGNSHGMSSPHYDASTGKGINGIQSKDVVALMDHLAARDGQRNARDTEMLVTLVRTAAETRDGFEEMKKLIEASQNATMRHTDRGIIKALNAPKPQILGSPRTPQSTEDLSGKKTNIFKRALKNLGSRSTNDLSRIQDTLYHLLDEVAALKGAQANPDSAPALAPRDSLDSYEQMRAAPESGYEPEGQAGTGSTPSQSRYFSTQSQQTQSRMYSGVAAQRGTENRVSTVFERDEELDNYNGEDRLLTPTQEVQQQRSSGFAVTPQRQSDEYRDIDEVSPPSDEKNRNTKSTSSSLWGPPRVSRWSKTTASSDNRNSTATTPGRKDRPFSEASRSGSDLNVLPPDGAPWTTSEDDRLRSPNSLTREAEPSSSTFIPTPTTYPIPMPGQMEDPKYQANRKSLTLQHPQPRQGQTHRHQSNLETQAYAYDNSPTDMRYSGEVITGSPDSGTFGSVPSLSRLPVNMGSANRTSIQQRHYSAGTDFSLKSNDSSPRSTRNMAPMVPAAAPVFEQHRVPDDDRYSNESPIQDDDSADSMDGESPGQIGAWENDPAIPLPRKRSPYSPGGLLAPIEERYSMEGDRSSIGYSLSQKSRRESVDLKNGGGGGGGGTGNNSGGSNSIDMTYQQQQQHGLADVMEQDEGDTTASPVSGTGPAGQADVPPVIGVAEVRKLTGPREMPRKVSNEPPSGLRGTVRRKPAAGAAASWED